MTTDNFTEAARAEAERQFPAPLYGTAWSQSEVQIKRALWESGAEWARTHLAAEAGLTDVAQIIDEHRVEKRWVGDGVRIECHCGHESNAVWDPAAGPFTEENNTHRVADRLHAVHVTDMLVRAVRRDEEKRDD